MRLLTEQELQEIVDEIADYAVGERQNAGMYQVVREFAMDILTRHLLLGESATSEITPDGQKT